MKLCDSAADGGDKQSQNFNREIREMISAITRRISDKPAGSTHSVEEGEQGVRIITLAGTNTGALMRSEVDHHHDREPNKSNGRTYSVQDDKRKDDQTLSTHANSNCQAVNNSLMMDSTYNTNDPGVHMDVFEDVGSPERVGEGRHLKHLKRGRGKKDKGVLKSDHHSSSHSD